MEELNQTLTDISMPHRHITRPDRVYISTCVRLGIKHNVIAVALGFHPSTIGREIKRGNRPDGRYGVRFAQNRANYVRWKENQRFHKIKGHVDVEEGIGMKLSIGWSPEQIGDCFNLAHSTIYNYVYSNCKELKSLLPRCGDKYRKKPGTVIRCKARDKAKKRCISTRPKVINLRKRTGDWEGDTIVSCKKDLTRIITLVERKTKYVKACLVPNGESSTVQEAIVKIFSTLPKKRKYSITLDNGVEFSNHELIEKQAKTKIYFAHPYHSWERGTNENTNGLIRRFLPKKTKLSNVTPEELKYIVKLLNHRPRKTLGYQTPSDVFNKIAIGTRM